LEVHVINWKKVAAERLDVIRRMERATKLLREDLHRAIAKELTIALHSACMPATRQERINDIAAVIAGRIEGHIAFRKG